MDNNENDINFRRDWEFNDNLHDQIECIRLQDITAIDNIISVLSTKIQDRGTGNIHTAIHVLEQLKEEYEDDNS